MTKAVLPSSRLTERDVYGRLSKSARRHLARYRADAQSHNMWLHAICGSLGLRQSWYVRRHEPMHGYESSINQTVRDNEAWDNMFHAFDAAGVDLLCFLHTGVWRRIA